MCVGGSFGGGNMFQANQAAAQITERFGIEGGAAGFIFGIIIVIVTTKNFTLLGLIIGILIFNYHKFFKKRKKNQAINSSRYFR